MINDKKRYLVIKAANGPIEAIRWPEDLPFDAIADKVKGKMYTEQFAPNATIAKLLAFIEAIEEQML